MADFIVAAIKLKSLQYDSDVGLSNNFDLKRDASQTVPRPQVTWSSAGSQTTADPAGYVMGTRPRFTVDVYPLTGSATTGLTTTLRASASNYDANLYATSGIEQTGFPMTRTAQNAVSSFVAKLTAHLDSLQFFVRISRTGNWGPASSYYTSNNHALYVSVASPTAPMAPPWVPVLDYACLWAYGTSDATSATSALTVGEYNNCTYNGGGVAHTSRPYVDAGEEFYLRDFLNGPNALWGQCRDFADFLVCLSNALGAQALRVQRSASEADYNLGSWFQTQPICTNKAYSPPGTSRRWAFHQWTSAPLIWDGCVVFGGTTNPGALQLDDYVAGIRSRWYYLWDPQPSFLPTVMNSPQP